MHFLRLAGCIAFFECRQFGRVATLLSGGLLYLHYWNCLQLAWSITCHTIDQVSCTYLKIAKKVVCTSLKRAKKVGKG